MENEKNRIEEPFRPEDTPNPPQIIDPNQAPERGEREEPVKAERKSGSPSGGDKKNDNSPTQSKEKPAEDEGKKKVLGESETEITDETTI